MNQVDEADLMALTEDGEAVPETCTCTAKCEAGAVNTACPVCKNNLTACTGPEPEATEPEADEPQEKETGGGMGGLVVFLVVVLMGGGAALYFFKFKKPKDNTREMTTWTSTILARTRTTRTNRPRRMRTTPARWNPGR